MESVIGRLLVFSDGKIMILCIVLMILGVIVILSKLIKVGISLLVAASLVAMIIQGVNTLKSEYNFELDNEHISVVLNEQKYEINFDAVDKIEVYGSGDNSILRLYKDNKLIGEVQVPSIIFKVAKPILEKQHIGIIDMSKK